MCKNATATAASLMQAIEPTIKSLLTLTNLINTPQGQAAIAAYDAAVTALQNWKSGTASEEVLELIEDFQTAFDALPIPSTYSALVNIILAGVETVIGVLTANSPVTTAPSAEENDPVAGHPDAASDEQITIQHQLLIAHATTAKVQTLVPGFRRSIWHSPESQYKSTWNKAVDENGFDPSLKVA